MQMWCVAGTSVSGSSSPTLHIPRFIAMTGLNSHVTVLNDDQVMKEDTEERLHGQGPVYMCWKTESDPSGEIITLVLYWCTALFRPQQYRPRMLYCIPTLQDKDYITS